MMVSKEVGQMAEKHTTSEAQREQQKLLAEALKRPGVAVAAEAYARIQVHAPATGSVTIKTGYATGGNAS
jgi:hypothetical protein